MQQQAAINKTWKPLYILLQRPMWQSLNTHKESRSEKAAATPKVCLDAKQPVRTNSCRSMWPSNLSVGWSIWKNRIVRWGGVGWGEMLVNALDLYFKKDWEAGGFLFTKTFPTALCLPFSYYQQQTSCGLEEGESGWNQSNHRPTHIYVFQTASKMYSRCHYCAQENVTFLQTVDSSKQVKLFQSAKSPI